MLNFFVRLWNRWSNYQQKVYEGYQAKAPERHAAALEQDRKNRLQ